MKISFSTLGCPEWRLRDIFITAKDLGYNGIELRGIGREIYLPKTKEFRPENIDKTIETAKKAGLEFSCVSSSCYMFNPPESCLQEGFDYIDLAQKIGSKYVRVLGDRDPFPISGVINDNQVKENLNELCKYAADKDVTLLIETNGVFGSSTRLKKLIDKIIYDNVGVLWDINHTVRYFNETIEETFANIGHHIKHVHIKDSVAVGTKVEYRMLGYGDLPVKQAIALLKKNGYNGYLSLEWVKRWILDLEEPGVAFAHYANYIKKLL